jgi:aryl-alcohol dehydrogenase-like predicted oxidoreductase
VSSSASCASSGSSRRWSWRWTRTDEYSILTHPAEPLFPVLEEFGIGFVAYSPLARGFLSGAVKSREHYDAIVSELTKLAESKGATLSQLALAWLLAKQD